MNTLRATSLYVTLASVKSAVSSSNLPTQDMCAWALARTWLKLASSHSELASFEWLSLDPLDKRDTKREPDERQLLLAKAAEKGKRPLGEVKCKPSERLAIQKLLGGRQETRDQLLTLYFLRVLYDCLIISPTNDTEANHITRSTRLLNSVQALLDRVGRCDKCAVGPMAKIVKGGIDRFTTKPYLAHMRELEELLPTQGSQTLQAAFRPHVQVESPAPAYTQYQLVAIGSIVGPDHKDSFDEVQHLASSVASTFLDPIASVDPAFSDLPWTELLGMLRGFTKGMRIERVPRIGKDGQPAAKSPPNENDTQKTKRWLLNQRRDDARTIYNYCFRMVDENLHDRYRAACAKVLEMAPGASAAHAPNQCACRSAQ